MVRLGLAEVRAQLPPPGPTDLGRIIEANGSSALIVAPRPGRHRGESDPRSDKAFSQAFKIGRFGDGTACSRPARKAFARDWALEEAAFAEKGRVQPGYLPSPSRRAQYGRGLSSTSTASPSNSATSLQEEINRYGPVISRYYEYYDQVIGKYLASLKDDELLVVYSPTASSPSPFGNGSSNGSSGIRRSRPTTRTRPTASSSSTGTGSGRGTRSRG